MLETIKRWALRCGIVVGDSGGAMLMTHTIEIAATFGDIQVPDDFSDFRSFGLVNFEFHPHLGTYGASRDELRTYSKQRIVYGAPDGCGLAVVDGKIESHGPVVNFKDGREEP